MNYQVPTYIPWNPDKNAYAIDGFSIMGKSKTLRFSSI